MNLIESKSKSERAAILAISVISLLIVMKLIAGVVTGSVGIRADAIHSIMDLSGAVIGLVGIRLAGRPPDSGHPYGHNKIENLAGAVIAVVIFLAAVAIVYEAVKRFFTGAAVEMAGVGIVVTVFAIVINIGISRYALRVAKSEDSVALETTARDLMADVMSSASVLAGLILVSITGVAALDPIAALFVAILIIRTASTAMKKSISGLLDTSLPREELESITRIIEGYGDRIAGWHQLRTRKAGAERFVEFHLLMPGNINVEDAHSFVDELQREIEAVLAPCRVTIHIEPCGDDCGNCSLTCDLDKK